ncbi:MAG: hypothetical protein C0412_06915 [Flavobacterium sp.]|nr:hypothetical protein [Flavobacterium sp.]
MAQVVDKQIELSVTKYYRDDEMTNATRKYTTLNIERFVKKICPSFLKLELFEKRINGGSFVIIQDVGTEDPSLDMAYYIYIQNSCYSFTYSDNTNTINDYKKRVPRVWVHSKKIIDLISLGKYDIIKEIMRKFSSDDSASYPKFITVYIIKKKDAIWHIEVILMELSPIIYRDIGDHIKYEDK